MLLCNDLTRKYDTIAGKINSTLEKNEFLRGRVIPLEGRVDEVFGNMATFGGRLTKLEGHTAEGQDRSIKIIMNLNGLQRFVERGRNFSDHLHSLWQLCSFDDRLRTMISELQSYEDIDASDAKIKSTFDAERTKIGEKPGLAKSSSSAGNWLMRLLENNVRIVKNGGSDTAGNTINLATTAIGNGDYEAFVAILGQDERFSEIFKETLKMALKRVELNKLVDNLFRTIYNP
jgi:hypothetical protein